MLPWMPTRACGRRRTFRESDATFSSRRRARNRAAVSGARIKSSVANQVPCELALVKLLSPFPPQCPARPPTPFTRRLPSSRLGTSGLLAIESLREREARRDTREGATLRASLAPRHNYIHTYARDRTCWSERPLSLSISPLWAWERAKLFSGSPKGALSWHRDAQTQRSPRWSFSHCIDGSPGTLDDASSPTCTTTANPAQTNSLSLQVQSGIRVGLTTVR
jgi:hypothetical protein